MMCCLGRRRRESIPVEEFHDSVLCVPELLEKVLRLVVLNNPTSEENNTQAVASVNKLWRATTFAVLYSRNQGLHSIRKSYVCLSGANRLPDTFIPPVGLEHFKGRHVNRFLRHYTSTVVAINASGFYDIHRFFNLFHQFSFANLRTLQLRKLALSLTKVDLGVGEKLIKFLSLISQTCCSLQKFVIETYIFPGHKFLPELLDKTIPLPLGLKILKLQSLPASLLECFRFPIVSHMTYLQIDYFRNPVVVTRILRAVSKSLTHCELSYFIRLCYHEHSTHLAPDSVLLPEMPRLKSLVLKLIGIGVLFELNAAFPELEHVELKDYLPRSFKNENLARPCVFPSVTSVSFTEMSFLPQEWAVKASELYPNCDSLTVKFNNFEPSWNCLPNIYLGFPVLEKLELDFMDLEEPSFENFDLILTGFQEEEIQGPEVMQQAIKGNLQPGIGITSLKCLTCLRLVSKCSGDGWSISEFLFYDVLMKMTALKELQLYYFHKIPEHMEATWTGVGRSIMEHSPRLP